MKAIICGAGIAAASDVSAAFARYEGLMSPVIADTQALGRRFIKWMAPDTAWRLSARDWILRLSALPAAGRLIRRSVSPRDHGLITGKWPQKPDRAAGRAS